MASKGQEITAAWREASTEQGHRPGTYQYDADLAARIDAAIAEAQVAKCDQQVKHDMATALAEEREACARTVESPELTMEFMALGSRKVAAAIRARGSKQG